MVGGRSVWWERDGGQLRQESQPEASTHKGPSLPFVRLDFYPVGSL